jgi:hypothetical protein
MGRILRPLVVAAATALLMALVSSVPSGTADDTQATGPDWIGKQLTLNTNVTTLASPESTQEELPGVGHKFELIGTMVRDTDPENMVGNSGASGGGVGGNEVISSISALGSFGLAFRNLPPGIKITALDNQLSFKSYYVAPRSCFGGSPRISLFVDADGDGDFDQDPVGETTDPADSLDFVAQGHVNPPSYMACAPGKWRFDDLADDLPRWEITSCTARQPDPQPPVVILPTITCPFPFNPWEALESAVTATFPNHRVIAGALIDDSCFAPGLTSCGKAYFDLVTIENRTLEIWHDTVQNR